MSDLESVVSEAFQELEAEGQRQQFEWAVRDCMERMPQHRNQDFDAHRMRAERKVAAELEQEAKKKAKELEKKKANDKKLQVQQPAQEQDDQQIKVTVFQNRTKLVMRLPKECTVLDIKTSICDGRPHNFRGTIVLERISLHTGGDDLPDDHKFVEDSEIHISLTKPTRKQRLTKAAEEEPADFEVLSGEKLLQHILDGGCLRNLAEEVAAQRFVDAMRKRMKKGDDSAEANKDVMLKALQARRIETAPAFVNDQQTRAVKHLSDFRAAGRTMQAAWQKATTAMHGMAELNEECWDRELLETEQPASKRFKRALDRPVPGPIVLDDDAEDDAQ